MIKKVIQQIEAWSFSRYNTYDGCPFKGKRLYIDKATFQSNDAMARGLCIHKLGENYLKGKLKAVPVEYAKFKKYIQNLKSLGAVPEEQWAFDRDWWPTGWFDGDAWLRIKIDVQLLIGTHLKITDWKTGKFRDGYENQLDLYAGGAFARHDGLEKVTTDLIYLDSGEKATETYLAGQAKPLIKKWENKIRPMLSDKKFIPNPTYVCRYCQFSKSTGDGSCRF